MWADHHLSAKSLIGLGGGSIQIPACFKINEGAPLPAETGKGIGSAGGIGQIEAARRFIPILGRQRADCQRPPRLRVQMTPAHPRKARFREIVQGNQMSHPIATPIDPSQRSPEWQSKIVAWATVKGMFLRSLHGSTPMFGVLGPPELRRAVREAVEGCLAQDSTKGFQLGFDVESKTQTWWAAFSVEVPAGVSYELWVFYTFNNNHEIAIYATAAEDPDPTDSTR